MIGEVESPAGRISFDTISSGLAQDEFVFYYQPIVSLVTGRLERAEALLRWTKPDGHLVLPDAFIPLAEAEGFISDITRQMVPKLAADLTIISDIDPQLSLSFNTSAQDFEKAGLAEVVREVVHPRLLGSHKLVAELTEPTILRRLFHHRHPEPLALLRPQARPQPGSGAGLVA